jgi:uncharacterized repeat protein (TIGR03806 family)
MPSGRGVFLPAVLLLAGCGGGGRSAGGPIVGLDDRPRNATCTAPASIPDSGSQGLPPLLSATGCFDAANPNRPGPALIPYSVNMPLWSDGADKKRWLALPDGATVRVQPDGDLDLPPGTVTIKTFELDGRAVETRFYVRLMDGRWGGYTYEWNEDGTDAFVLDEGSHRRPVGNREWYYPTRAECNKCHTEGAGRSLGLELGQLNGDLTYPGGRRANQLVTLQHIGLFDMPLSLNDGRAPRYPAPGDTRVSVEARARAYLHANCSNCHRPQVEGSGTTDFRYATPLDATMACGAEPLRDNLGAGPDARIIAPSNPGKSMVVIRMLELGRGRMPEVASLVVDQEGVALVSDWIRSLTGCQ